MRNRIPFRCLAAALAVAFAMMSRQPCDADTIVPEAVFTGFGGFPGYARDIHHERSLSLAWSRYDPQYQRTQSFLGTVQLTGEKQPMVEVMAEFTNCSNLNVEFNGGIEYYFTFTKKDPSLPDAVVPFTIEGSLHASVYGSPTKAFATAYASYRNEAYSTSVGLGLVTATDNQPTDEETFGVLAGQPTGALGRILVAAQGKTRPWALG